MFENRVREFRLKAGLSQVELARKARIAESNLSAIEHRRLMAWPRARRALARVLKTTVEELFPNNEVK